MFDINDLKQGDLIIVEATDYFSAFEFLAGPEHLKPQIFLRFDEIYSAFGDYYRIYTSTGQYTIPTIYTIKILARFSDVSHV